MKVAEKFVLARTRMEPMILLTRWLHSPCTHLGHHNDCTIQPIFCLSTQENIIKTKTTLLWFACCNINQPMTYDNHVTRTIPTHYAVMTSKRFPHYCPFAMGILSHHKGSVVRCVDVCLIFTRTSHWTNSRVVDEFRRYDARVMSLWRRMKWDICWITVRCFSHHCWIPLTGHYMIPTALNHHGSCWCPSAKWGTRSSATSVFDPLYLILLTPPTLLDRCKVWKINTDCSWFGTCRFTDTLLVNPFWSSDAMWRHRFESRVSQAMA